MAQQQTPALCYTVTRRCKEFKVLYDKLVSRIEAEEKKGYARIFVLISVFVLIG